MNLTPAQQASYAGGQYHLRDFNSPSLRIGRISRVVVESLPLWSGISLAVYCEWTLFTDRPERRPYGWRRTGGPRTPEAFRLTDYTFTNQGSRLVIEGIKSGKRGVLAVPGDALFDEAEIPEALKSW